MGYLILKSHLILDSSMTKRSEKMPRKEIKGPINDLTLNNTNHNFMELYNMRNVLQTQINDLVLGSGDSNPEVVQSRGGHQVLADRLNSMDTDTNDLDIKKADKVALQTGLNSKRDKNVEIDMSDLSQNVREAFTGGSTPVVGEDSVGTVNLRKGAVTSDKTSNDMLIKTPGKRDESDLDYIWEAGNHLVNGAANQPTSATSVLTVTRYKSDNINAPSVWIKQDIMGIGENFESFTRILYVNENDNTVGYKREWKEIAEAEKDEDKYFYLNGDNYDLDSTWVKGNYIVNSAVRNNPFGVGGAMTIEDYKTSVTSSSKWVTQTLTTYGGELGRKASRLLYVNENTETVNYKSDWKFYGGNQSGGSAEPNKKIKLLFIGNSFSLNATEYIHQMCAEEYVDATVGVLYISGGSLEQHWNNVQNNGNSYVYHLKDINNGVQAYTTQTNYTIDQALESDDWDYVAFNQSSSNSGVYESFEPYLTNLINYVKDKLPNAKIAFMPTWAYFSDFNNPDYDFIEPGRFDKYNNDQLTMYNAILDTYKQVMGEHEFDLIIPAGTAIQNARTDEFLNGLGYELTRDGYHLNDIGMYAVGVTLFKSLFKREIKSGYKPNISSKEAYFAQVSATTAVNNPFTITNI